MIGCRKEIKNSPIHILCGSEYWNVKDNKLTRRYCKQCEMDNDAVDMTSEGGNE